VNTGTMVDTWATVGSCAQIGKNVHLSGGVGIGGVLEPMQAGPTIIEDNCFIGARSEVVEGCIVREGSVLGLFWRFKTGHFGFVKCLNNIYTFVILIKIKSLCARFAFFSSNL
jgi:UDP-3-O-[3-hydroxymyristoyl] glucosamine N-acyltransferase